MSGDQIIRFIKQAAAGMPIKELCRKRGFSDATFYKWRKLKRLLAEAHLDIHALNTAFGVKR